MKGDSGRIRGTLSHNPVFVEKVKTIKGRRWHSEDKYWDFLYSEVNQKRPNEHIHNAYMFLKWKDVRTNSDTNELYEIACI